jgi:hypothetical protein
MNFNKYMNFLTCHRKQSKQLHVTNLSTIAGHHITLHPRFSISSIYLDNSFVILVIFTSRKSEVRSKVSLILRSPYFYYLLVNTARIQKKYNKLVFQKQKKLLLDSWRFMFNPRERERHI